MKLALLYGLISAETEKPNCPFGTSVGINLSGRPRPENTNVCYPTYRGARVVTCDNKQGGVEMTAVFQGTFLTDVPADFVQLGQGFYMGRFNETELDVRFTREGLLMTKTIRILGTRVICKTENVLKAMLNMPPIKLYTTLQITM